MANPYAYKRQIEIAPSAARTATFTSSTKTSPYHTGVRLVLAATALTGAPSIIMKVQFFDEESQTWIDQLVDAAVTTAAPTTSTLLVHPNAPDTLNVSTPDYLGRTWRVVVTHGTADPITYSVGAELLP